MSFELIGIGYFGAIVACFVGAIARPRWRGALIGLGTALIVLSLALAVYVVIAAFNTPWG